MNSLNNHGIISLPNGISSGGDLDTIVAVLSNLPTTEESVPKSFLNTPVDHIRQVVEENKVESEPINNYLEGSRRRAIA